jgi:hypothetical protein
MKKTAIFLIIATFALCFYAIPAFSMDDYTDRYIERPNYWSTNRGDAMLYDLILLRPVGLASMIVGLASTIVALPFSITANNTQEVGDALVGETTRFTFCRPLGEIFPTHDYLDR